MKPSTAVPGEKSEKRICALIPAAGKGTRLKANCPKILVPIDDDTTVWTILRSILLPHAAQIHVVLSDFGEPLLQEVLQNDPEKNRISTNIQEQALGMGNAIFCAESFWRDFDTVLIVWGDQVNLSSQTIAKVVAKCGHEKTLVLPLSRQPDPYVQYDFENDERKKLIYVRQSREGEKTTVGGFSDIGLFALSSKGLWQHWQDFLAVTTRGEATGEVNFLPFMPYLSKECGWNVETLLVEDIDEARGVNTQEDLEFARQRHRRFSQAEA